MAHAGTIHCHKRRSQCRVGHLRPLRSPQVANKVAAAAVDAIDGELASRVCARNPVVSAQAQACVLQPLLQPLSAALRCMHQARRCAQLQHTPACTSGVHTLQQYSGLYVQAGVRTAAFVSSTPVCAPARCAQLQQTPEWLCKCAHPLQHSPTCAL
jgi:hypothetical protein